VEAKTLLPEGAVLQIYLSFKEQMTYKEAIAYIGRSESWFKSRLSSYCITHNAEGFYAKSDLDRIKNAKKEAV
jgi:hypothetical protein